MTGDDHQMHAQATVREAKNTRAQAPARDRGSLTVRRVTIPPGPRRTRFVFVEVERDGLRMVFAVMRLRGGDLSVRPPRLPDGTGEGLWMPKRERDRIADAVIAAALGDPVACEVVAPYR